MIFEYMHTIYTKEDLHHLSDIAIFVFKFSSVQIYIKYLFEPLQFISILTTRQQKKRKEKRTKIEGIEEE